LKLKRVAVHTNTIQIHRTGPHTKTHVGVFMFRLTALRIYWRYGKSSVLR